MASAYNRTIKKLFPDQRNNDKEIHTAARIVQKGGVVSFDGMKLQTPDLEHLVGSAVVLTLNISPSWRMTEIRISAQQEPPEGADRWVKGGLLGREVGVEGWEMVTTYTDWR